VPSQPIPFGFQLYFYSSIVIAVLFSLVAIVLHRRVVRQNMIAVGQSDAVPPTTAIDREAALRVLPAGPMSDYSTAETRLKRRLVVIYGAAIFGVTLLAAWIRFFTGNTTLIRGSIMFMMWQGYLGRFGALAVSGALFAAIGIPLLAVLLAWSWWRAAAVFVLHVSVWAAAAFTIIVVFFGWRQADWASTLVLAQVYLIGLIAPQPFLLLLLTGNRRVRAVAPMTLAGSLVLCGALLGMFSLTVETYRLHWLPAKLLELLGHSGTLFVMAGGIALFVCWCLLRLLGNLYAKKVYSDCQMLVDCWSLVMIMYVFARLGETPGTPKLFIASAFVLFFVYSVLIHAALRLFLRGIERPPNRRLLLLRTFGFQKRTERLFDGIGQRWRFHGPVLMIAGTDLAARTINPDDYLRFLSRRLSQRFIKTAEDLERNLERLDDRPDPDGRYRINELFCADRTWYQALVGLLDRADVVLMDLRGFGPKNSGCVFEIQQLVERGPEGRMFLVVDDTTDRPFLNLTIQDAWRRMPDDVRRDDAKLTLVPVEKRSRHAQKAIFAALHRDAGHRSVQTGQTAGQANQVGADLRLKRIWFLAAIATSLLAAVVIWTRWGDALTNSIGRVFLQLDSAESHYNRGVELDRQGNYKAAIEEYRKAVALKSALAEGHYNLAVDLDHEGNYAAGMAEYRNAIAVKPDLADAHYNLGVDLDRQDDYEAAISEYRKEVAVNAGDADAHYNLGVDLFRKDELETAIAEFRRALALKTNWPEAHIFLGGILFRRGDDEAAIVEFREALAAKPNSPQIHYNLAVVLSHKGDREAAITEYRRALALKSDYTEAHYNCAQLLHATGKRREAEREFDEAHGLNPALKRPWH